MNFIAIEIGWVGLTTLLVLIASLSYDRRKTGLDDALFIRLLSTYKTCGKFIKYVMIYIFISIIILLSFEVAFEFKSKYTLKEIDAKVHSEQSDIDIKNSLNNMQLTENKVTDTSIKVEFKEYIFYFYKNYNVILNR